MSHPSERPEVGEIGEKRIVKLIPCPNCGHKLVQYPKGRPLFDVHCENCEFKAQLKTNKKHPGSMVFGAGWDIMDKYLKAGYLVPPLVILYQWKMKDGHSCEQVYFYPFLTRKNLKMRKLSKHARRAGYKMFNYVDLNTVPCIRLRECQH